MKIKNEYVLHEDFAELIITRKDGTKIFCQIDLDKINLIKEKQWCYCPNGYVRSNGSNGQTIILHRFLIGAKKQDVVDHIDGNPLNNRMNNLRFCSKKQNGQNSRNRHKPNGIIGVRKDLRCKNSYRAQIYFSSNKYIGKTFKDKDLAILRRLTWELIYFKEFSPQIELIKKDYPYLLNYFCIQDSMTFNDDMETIKKIGENLLKDPHCPCMAIKNDNTICPCLPCREKKYCYCGLFVPKNSSEDLYLKKYGSVNN